MTDRSRRLPRRSPVGNPHFGHADDPSRISSQPSLRQSDPRTTAAHQGSAVTSPRPIPQPLQQRQRQPLELVTHRRQLSHHQLRPSRLHRHAVHDPIHQRHRRLAQSAPRRLRHRRRPERRSCRHPRHHQHQPRSDESDLHTRRHEHHYPRPEQLNRQPRLSCPPTSPRADLPTAAGASTTAAATTAATKQPSAAPIAFSDRFANVRQLQTQNLPTREPSAMHCPATRDRAVFRRMHPKHLKHALTQAIGHQHPKGQRSQDRTRQHHHSHRKTLPHPPASKALRRGATDIFTPNSFKVASAIFVAAVTHADTPLPTRPSHRSSAISATTILMTHKLTSRN